MGKTHSKWIDVIVEDTGGTLRSIPVNSINGMGLEYDELELTAFQDQIKNSVLGHPQNQIEVSGPFTTDAAAAAGTLSGSHTILAPLAGGETPKSIDIQVGMGAAWEAGDPQFGLTADSDNGYICSMYQVDPSSMTYTARFVIKGGAIAPAWGTAAESAAS